MTKKKEYYTVLSHRWGNPNNHSYPIGVFDNKPDAIKAAEMEADARGGKYNCFVYEFPLNEYNEEQLEFKIVYKTTTGI